MVNRSRSLSLSPFQYSTTHIHHTKARRYRGALPLVKDVCMVAWCPIQSLRTTLYAGGGGATNGLEIGKTITRLFYYFAKRAYRTTYACGCVRCGSVVHCMSDDDDAKDADNGDDVDKIRTVYRTTSALSGTKWGGGGWGYTTSAAELFAQRIVPQTGSSCFECR